ncbi:MAG TPA: hypothetical protein VGB83_04150 [Actinomycetota bacterium]
MPRAPRRSRHAAIVALILLPTFGWIGAAEAGHADACEHVPGIGRACRRANGLLEVFSPSGGSLGFVHGLDAAPAKGGNKGGGGKGGGKGRGGGGTTTTTQDPVAERRAPSCANPATDPYYTVAIYARAFDDADNFGASLPSIRDTIAEANGLVFAAAAKRGDAADLEFLCDAAGEVAVAQEVLPTPMDGASFSTIVGDLRARGYSSGQRKYLVFYDDTGACACGGTGHVYADSRLTSANYNNGNASSMFAVDFGYLSARIMLHELSHNMGAVQNDAPNSTGGYHCTDGLDTMCYADGGPRSVWYTTSRCPRQEYDCGDDDYFNTRPDTGSYLAGHWNLGSTLNRFVRVTLA